MFITNRATESPIKSIGSPQVIAAPGMPMNSVNCNLCGTLGSSIKCDRCDSKSFCLSCDDMYHRHPKRRFHLRKTINPLSSHQTGYNETISPMGLKQISSCPFSTTPLSPANCHSEPVQLLSSPSPSIQNNSNNASPGSNAISLINKSQFQVKADSSPHPSKMPIPPPRRKKKQQQQEEPNRSNVSQFGQTRVIQYQTGSNYRSVDHLNQAGRYLNDQPLQAQQPFNQVQQQQRLNYNSLRPFEEEYRRGSLNTETPSSNLSSVNSSSLSSEQWSNEIGPPPMVSPAKWSQSLPRKNLSLMDLSSSYLNPGSSPYYQHPMHGPPFPPSGPMMLGQHSMVSNPTLPPHHPLNYGASPYHHQPLPLPHGPYGIHPMTQSMEDLGLDNSEDQNPSDEDYPNHGTLTRSKSRASSVINQRNGSMKRAQSSFLVNNNRWHHHQQMSSPYWAGQPAYPMYPGYPVNPHQRLPYNNMTVNEHSRGSPSPSLRSLNLNRKVRSGSREQSVRSSVTRETSPGMMRKSSFSSSSSSHHNRAHHYSSHNNQPSNEAHQASRSKMFDHQHLRRRRRPDSIPRSVTSSSQSYSMRASDSEDEEEDERRSRLRRNGDDDDDDNECDYLSQSADEDIDDEDDVDRYSQASSLKPDKWWTCYACTYVNRPNSGICEMCGKSHPSRLKKMIPDERSRSISRQPGDGGNKKNEKSVPLKAISSSQHGRRATGVEGGQSEVVITTDLIREQMEIEKELRRRLENEKRVESENRRLERREEKKRNQSVSSSFDQHIGDLVNQSTHLGNNNSSDQLINSAQSQSTEPVPTRVGDSMRTSEDADNLRMRFKARSSSNQKFHDDAGGDDCDDNGDHHNDSKNNAREKVRKKFSAKYLTGKPRDDDELDWPDSVRKNDDPRRGERSMSPLLTANFQDIEATFEKLEQEIDLIRSAANLNHKSKESDPKRSGEIGETVNGNQSTLEKGKRSPGEVKINQQPTSSPSSSGAASELTGKGSSVLRQDKPTTNQLDGNRDGNVLNNDNRQTVGSSTEVGDANVKPIASSGDAALCGDNRANEPVAGGEVGANETSSHQPLINSQLVNQPINQSPHLIPGSPVPMALPTVNPALTPTTPTGHVATSSSSMFPGYPHQYPMVNQPQMTPVNQSSLGTSPIFSGYEINRIHSPGNYMGMSSAPTTAREMINHPLAMYAGSNYLNQASSMYNLSLVGPLIDPQAHLSAQQTVQQDSLMPFARHRGNGPNGLSYLNQSRAFTSTGQFMSSENLSMDNRPNQGATVSSAQSQLQSGFQMFKLLRDAEKKGFTADDIEMALTFNSTAPLDWLDENWNNMVETVLTLSNNQLVQNEKKRLGKKYKLTAIDLVTAKDARSALRSTKGNIWQAIDKCVQKKEEDKIAVDKRDVKSFSLEIEESGSGKSNMDAVPFALLTTNVVDDKKRIDPRDDDQGKTKSSEVDKSGMDVDRCSLSRSSSSSGEYFSEPSEDDDEVIEVKRNDVIGNPVEDEEEDEKDEEDDGNRMINFQVKYLDAFDERAEDEEEENSEDDEDGEKRVEETVEPEDTEEDEDEDEVNEELVRLRADSNEKGEEEDKEVEDYENLRRSLKQRLSQLGINSIEGFIDDSEEEGDDDDVSVTVVTESEAHDEGERNDENEINGDYEILNRDDFDSNDSDEWSEHSEEELSIPLNGDGSEKGKAGNSKPIGQQVVSFTSVEQSYDPEAEITRVHGSPSKLGESSPEADNEEIDWKESKRKEPIDRHSEKGSDRASPVKTTKQEAVAQIQELLPVSQVTNLPVIDKESLNPHFGYARSAYECELCAGSFHIRDMISLISCTHKACINCLRQYFSVQIREASVFIIKCPFCSEPNISTDDEDSVCDYLSLLDQLVKSIVTADLHELWQRKVRDKVLSKDPSFRWCANCSSGFIASNPAAKTIACPDCKIVTCASCHQIWEEQHSGITCQQFNEWKRSNDPGYSDNQLELHLKQFGIDCPNCHFHYELSKGGCMHFHCVQCAHDFCGGCRHPFRLGSRCEVSKWCDKLGLHAHHPRNCLFYLRDKEVNELRKLLDLHHIDYKYREDKQSTEESQRVCMVMEQKEYPEGLRDMPCGNYLETAGVCKQHYIEYLGGLVFEHSIDPIEIFTEDELVHVLRRNNIKLPVKKANEDYRLILCESIRKECPLIKEPIKV